MAAVNPEKLLAELTCSVCTDYFKDPVCLDCGHNFCQACITRWWKGSTSNFRCPECRTTFCQRNFKPNRHHDLRNIVEACRTLTLESAKEPEVERVGEKRKRTLDFFCQEDQIPISVAYHLPRDHREHTVVPIDEAAKDYKDQVRSHLEILKKEREEIRSFKLSGESKSQELLKQLQTEKQKIVSEFQLLHQFLKEQKRLWLAQLEELNKEIKKRRDEYVTKLSEEISSISSLIREMEHKCQQPVSEFLQDIKGTVSRCKREKFQNPVAFSSDLKWRIWDSSQNSAVLVTIVKKFKDSLSSRQQLDKVNMTLDPDTAHPDLTVSADQKTVRLGCTRQALPDNPERFDTAPCVLGFEGFTSGRHSWEVEVEEMGVCAVGVARESVSRKGGIQVNPEQGIWAVEGWGDQYWALMSAEQRIRLSLSQAPRRIRVYLDYERGQVMFFDAGHRDPIFTFPPASFAGERIRPFFQAGVSVPVFGVLGTVRLTLCP